MTTAADSTDDTPGYVGRIPIRNLWLLMLYASDMFRMRGTDLVGREAMPDELPDLVAKILARAVEKRQRRNLSRAYERRRAVLDRVRGRIDVLPTERRQLLKRGKVACRFEELTIDTPRNRYVRGALNQIAGLVREQDLAYRCRKLARELLSLGVRGDVPTRYQMSSDRFGRHDANDRFMVAAAKLAFDLALLNESAGGSRLPVPHREADWLRKLFERAVGGFYKVALAPMGWQVNPGTWLYWPVQGKTPRADAILPQMKTDITLQHRSSARKIVVDTKFTPILERGHYREETLKSGYLYQIYAYLRSQVDDEATPAEGLLLHPSVSGRLDEAVRIQGHIIRFVTVNLADGPEDLRKDLLRAVEQVAQELRPCH